MNVENNNWKIRVQAFLNSAQSEIKKTTAIGKRMISASQSNTQLKECYEKLGQMTLDAIKTRELKWDNPAVEEIILEVERLELELKSLEEEVQNIKKE